MQVRVKVEAGAKKEVVEVLPNNRLKIAVKQKAKAGGANARVIELVAKHFNVPVKKVHITRGHNTPSKIVEMGER